MIHTSHSFEKTSYMGTLNVEILTLHVGHKILNIFILFAYVLYCVDF
jgi:hypothetical protein